MRHTTRRAIHAALTTGRALAAAARGPRHLLTYAAETGRRVLISYMKENGESSTRTIAPAEVRQSKAGHWYVRAYDLLRGDKRSFRLDRITTLETA